MGMGMGGVGGPGMVGGAASKLICSVDGESFESHKIDILLLSLTGSDGIQTIVVSSSCSTLVRGSRHPQPLVGGVVVVVPLARLSAAVVRERIANVVDPFIMFFKVASVLWPALGRLHVMDVWFLN